jgi:hypothetical protein
MHAYRYKTEKSNEGKRILTFIGNENIQNVNIQKLLGIYLDHNLDWKNQIDYICKNINSRLFLFAKIKKISTKMQNFIFQFLYSSNL